MYIIQYLECVCTCVCTCVCACASVRVRVYMSAHNCNLLLSIGHASPGFSHLLHHFDHVIGTHFLHGGVHPLLDKQHVRGAGGTEGGQRDGEREGRREGGMDD